MLTSEKKCKLKPASGGNWYYTFKMNDSRIFPAGSLQPSEALEGPLQFVRKENKTVMHAESTKMEAVSFY